MLLKEYLPQGVIKVVKSLLRVLGLFAKNPEFAFSLENIWPLDNWDNKSLIRGSGYNSFLTPLYNLARSTHILIPPFAFGAIVRPEHHSMGISTGSITC